MSQSECPLPAIQDELLLFTIAAKSVFHNASCAMVRKRRMSVSLFTFCWLIAMAATAAGEQAKTCDASAARTAGGSERELRQGDSSKTGDERGIAFRLALWRGVQGVYFRALELSLEHGSRIV